MYIILMDTHKGQTKYCITLNDEDSNIVKITRAKPGTIPGRWHSEEEVKLDSISQDVYGTSKQNVEKMFQEIAESKVDAADEKADDKEESADEKADEKKINVIENDMKADSKDVTGADKEAKGMADKAAHSRALTEAIAARRQQIGEGRKTRKNNKRTTRKKNRKGSHSKSNKNKRKHTRGKK